MKRAFRTLLLFSCMVLTPGQVSWFLNTTEARLEETDTIELVCKVTGSCCNLDRTWIGGIGYVNLMTNGFPLISSKYEETIDASSNQFSLLIHNVSNSDVNVDYQCRYGFGSSTRRQLFMNESIFRYVTKSTEINVFNWTNNGALFVTINVTRVFPVPTCTAFDKDKVLTPTVTTYDNNIYKYSEIKLQNIEYHCPGTLNVTCSVGSYSFPVLTISLCKTDPISNLLLALLTLLLLPCVGISYAVYKLWWKFRHHGQIMNNYSVDYGEKIELLSSSLSQYGRRIISVKWIVNGKPVPDEENYHGGNLELPTLVISRAALHDAGMYKCILILQDEQEEKVITAHLDVIVYTGDKVCLLENIQVTDAIQTVQWMHEKICLSVDDHLYYKGGTSECPSLTITNLALNDAGNYTCRITFNNSPPRTFPVKLIVHEKLCTTDAGGTIKLLKSIKKSKDVLSVTWFFKGNNISAVDSSIYKGGNKQCPPLTICLVDSTDEGTYQCNVIFTNKEERHITVKLRVNVQEYTARTGGSMILLPQLSRDTFTQVTWTDASGHVINADERITSAEIANGAEASEVSRFSGGSIECPSLAINKLTEADSQEYHCQLLFADQSSRTIKVILSVGGERFRPLPPIGNSTNNTVSSK